MAPALFYIKGVAPKEVDFGRHIVAGTIPFIGLQIVGVALIAAFPPLTLWLPGVMIR
jgi:TRAP-type mannitol/chloroaromatic compound transport system permease large subunit